MFNYKIWYCKSRMVAFINDELPLKSRRRVARYIDECDVCYAEYIQQKQLQRDLVYKLPIIAEPSKAQVDIIWAGIQASLHPNARPVRRRYRARYGVITFAVLLVVMLPFMLGNALPSTAVYAATQPLPFNVSIAETTVAPSYYARPVAMSTMTAEHQRQVHETEIITKDEIEPHLTPGIVLIPGD